MATNIPLSPYIFEKKEPKVRDNFYATYLKRTGVITKINYLGIWAFGYVYYRKDMDWDESKQIWIHDRHKIRSSYEI